MKFRKRRRRLLVSLPLQHRTHSHQWWATVQHEHIFLFPFKHNVHPAFDDRFSIELIAAKTSNGRWFLEFASPYESLSAWPAVFDPEAPLYRRPLFFTTHADAVVYAKNRVAKQYRVLSSSILVA
jgi:hypothetical protein